MRACGAATAKAAGAGPAKAAAAEASASAAPAKPAATATATRAESATAGAKAGATAAAAAPAEQASARGALLTGMPVRAAHAARPTGIHFAGCAFAPPLQRYWQSERQHGGAHHTTPHYTTVGRAGMHGGAHQASTAAHRKKGRWGGSRFFLQGREGARRGAVKLGGG